MANLNQIFKEYQSMSKNELQEERNLLLKENIELNKNVRENEKYIGYLDLLIQDKIDREE